MGVYFGTDGIRGVVNSSLNHDIILKCGNALAHLNPRAKRIEKRARAFKQRALFIR